MSHGIKVSLPGYDVQTCTVKQCSLHSDYTAFKNRKIGSVSLTAGTTATIAHNFGYSPNYCGFYTGTRYDKTGLIPFGYNEVNSSLRSWTDETNLYLLSNVNTTAYYYLLAELGGLPPTTLPALPDYGDYGLMVSEPGVDILSAQPYQLNFLSTYPNFKLYEERTDGGFSIPVIDGNANIGSSDTVINFTDANKYGTSGKAVIAGYQMINYDSYRWCYAEAPSTSTIIDSLISDHGVLMEVHISGGSTISGYWTPSDGFQGNVRWTGSDPIVFEYYKDGSWRQINGANSWTFDWNTLSGTNIKNWYHNGNDMWVEFYELDGYRPACNLNLGGQVQEYKEEKFTYTGTSSTQFTGVTRGVDSTSARSWVRDGGHNWFTIAPIQMIKQISTNPFSYNPVFFAWGAGPYEVIFSSLSDVILSSNNFYLHNYRVWEGSSDYWLTGALPYNTQGVYYKIMYDEIGT